MADTAAHLVDRVFPHVPVRQWVLSLPFALRYRLAYDAQLVTGVLQIFAPHGFGFLTSPGPRIRRCRPRAVRRRHLHSTLGREPQFKEALIIPRFVKSLILWKQ